MSDQTDELPPFDYIREPALNAAEEIQGLAAELWNDTRNRSPNRGRPRTGTEVTDLRKRAAVILIRCEAAAVAPPIHLVDTLLALLGVPRLMSQKPSLPVPQWEALNVEVNGEIDIDRDGWPNKTPASEIAKRTGLAKSTITRWRTQRAYWLGLVYLLADGLTERRLERLQQAASLAEDNPWDDDMTIEERSLHQLWWKEMSKQDRRARWLSIIRPRWRGPIESPNDPEIILNSPEEVADCYAELGVMPSPGFDEDDPFPPDIDDADADTGIASGPSKSKSD